RVVVHHLSLHDALPILLKTEQSFQEAFDRPEMVTEERWIYYDRERYRVYARRKGADWVGGAPTPQGDGAVLVEAGLHGLAGVRQDRESTRLNSSHVTTS